MPISLSSYQEDGNVVIEIGDSATPISAEEQTVLFQPYNRLKGSGTGGGLGLGLSMSKSLVELHGGRIWVEPNTAANIFKFSLPVISNTENYYESAADRR